MALPLRSSSRMAYNGLIGTGTSRTGSISYNGDYDTFNTTFIAGLTYSVAAKGASSGSGSPFIPITSSASICPAMALTAAWRFWVA